MLFNYESDKFKDYKPIKSYEEIIDNVKIIRTTMSTKPGCWEVCKVDIFLKDELVAHFDHEYSRFPATILNNNNIYLISPTSTYMVGMVFDLISGKSVKLTPDNWCPASFYLSPCKNYLAVSGCYWACGYDILTYIISDPLNPIFTGRYEEPRDISDISWNNEIMSFKHIAYTGLDGLCDEDPPWKAFDILNGEVVSIPNKQFDDNGEYSSEFLANFQMTMSINTKQKND